MTDNTVNIEFLKSIINNFIENRNWSQYHNLKDLAISISLESAELLELFQWKDNIDSIKEDPVFLQKMKDELADIFIYSIIMSNNLGIDISTAIKQKLDKNNTKYPVDKSKNNVKKYTEL